MAAEFFVKIEGYDYCIGSSGTLKRIFIYKDGRVSERICKPGIQIKGYLSVGISKNGIAKTCLVHRLVAKYFVENPDSHNEVNHKNGNKKDNNFDNLQWCTHQENMDHALANNLIKTCDKSGLAKINNSSAKYIRTMYKKGMGETFAMMFGISRSTVHAIVNNRSWKSL